MDSIQAALEAFQHISNYTYDFVIAHNKQLYSVRLTFDDKDFHHLVGLHYLKDIDIPKNHKKLFGNIKNGKLTDDYLSKSKNYIKIKDNDAIVKDRIHNFRYIENFLDSRNLVFNYVNYMNINSKIDADYMIKSTYNGINAYIFIKERRNNLQNEYCMCSFFVNSPVAYNGQKAYWRYKAKTHNITNLKEIFIDKMSENK